MGRGKTNVSTAPSVAKLTLSDQDPSTWSPGRGEECNTQTDERNHDLDIDAGGVNGTDNGNDELTAQHAERTPKQDSSPSESLDHPKGDWGGQNVDKGGDETDQERVGDCAELLEKGGTKVETAVSTIPEV